MPYVLLQLPFLSKVNKSIHLPHQMTVIVLFYSLNEKRMIIYLLLSEEAANFIASSVVLAFALEIKMVEYNNHDKILYYRKKDSSS
jgi:hypothetical protein